MDIKDKFDFMNDLEAICVFGYTCKDGSQGYIIGDSLWKCAKTLELCGVEIVDLRLLDEAYLQESVGE